MCLFSHLADVREEAKLVAGGLERPVQHPDQGYYVQNTVFSNVSNKAQIAQQEIFGPVLRLVKGANDAWHVCMC